MKRRGFLTPDTFEGATEICRPLSVPLPLLHYVGGALSELTIAHNWEQSGTMTPEEAAERFTAILAAWIGQCANEGACTLAFDIDLTFPWTLKIIRRGDGGHTEELVDGVWQPPTGDYEIPDPVARSETTSDERRCLAAINAATVLDNMYEEATDAYTEFSTLQGVADAILGVIASVMGLFGQVTAASYMLMGKNYLDTFFDIAGVVASDVWNNDFTDTLTCILYEHAIDTAGVINFDFDAINNALFELQVFGLEDLDRALLISQVGYLLSVIAADGLNVAGTTTAVTVYSCASCEEWCYTFDFAVSNGGWAARTPSAYATNGAFYGVYQNARWEGQFKNWSSGAPDWRNAVDIVLSMPGAANITSVTIFYDKLQGTLQLTNTDAIQVGASGTSRASTSSPGGVQQWTWTGDVDLLAADLLGIRMIAHRDFSSPYTNAGFIYILGVEIHGIGVNPFGPDNC